MTDNQSQTQRYLITKYQIKQDKVYLWPKGMRHAELILFDISDLQEAGIDWESAKRGVEVDCRFWAYWTLSDKRKSTGSQYKDVIRLEPLDTPATSTSVDTSALQSLMGDVLGELKAIKALLAHQIERSAVTEEIPDAGTVPPPREVPDEPQEAEAEPAPPENLAEALFGSEDDVLTTISQAEPPEHPAAHLLPPKPDVTNATEDPDRARFYELVAEALREQLVTQATIDAIVADSNGHGWRLATNCLTAETKRAKTWTAKQRERHADVVTRLGELLKSPQVEGGWIETKLKPGWRWLTGYSALIAEGKRIKSQLQDEIPF